MVFSALSLDRDRRRLWKQWDQRLFVLVSTGDYVLGVDGSVSGSLGIDGVNTVNGIRAGLDIANAHGGANGHHIGIVVRDDGSDPTRAVANVREFKSLGASAMIGFTASAPSAGAAPLAQELAIPLFAAVIASTALNPVQKYIFTSDADYTKYAAAQVDIVKQLAGTAGVPASPRIAIFNFASPAGQAWHDAILPVISKDGFQLVAQESSLPSSTDYSAQVARIAAAKPDVILDIINPTGIKALTNAMISQGMPSSTLIVGFISTTTLAFMSSLPWKNFISLTTANFPLDSTVPVLKDARTEAAYLGQDPNYLLYLNGYMQALIMVDALKRCGYPCSGAKMASALENTNLDTAGLAFGPLVLSPTSHAAITRAGFLKVDPTTNKAVAVGKPIDLAAV